MLSSASRSFTAITGLAYLLTGVILVAAPRWASEHFAWSISPFIAMTMGGWCLGNAWAVLVIISRWDWARVRTSLIYLWLFGLLQFGVLIAFRDKVNLTHPVAWLYLATISVNCITALVGIVDLTRMRVPDESTSYRPMPWSQRALSLFFVIFVGYLASYGLRAGAPSSGTNGAIFPEPMTLFTLRAFAVFYLSLALSVFPLLFAKRLETQLTHGLAAFGLATIITVITLLHLDLFDFEERPRGMLYLGAYVADVIVQTVIFVIYGTGGQNPTDSATSVNL